MPDECRIDILPCHARYRDHHVMYTWEGGTPDKRKVETKGAKEGAKAGAFRPRRLETFQEEEDEWRLEEESDGCSEDSLETGSEAGEKVGDIVKKVEGDARKFEHRDTKIDARIGKPDVNTTKLMDTAGRNIPRAKTKQRTDNKHHDRFISAPSKTPSSLSSTHPLSKNPPRPMNYNFDGHHFLMNFLYINNFSGDQSFKSISDPELNKTEKSVSRYVFPREELYKTSHLNSNDVFKTKKPHSRTASFEIRQPNSKVETLEKKQSNPNEETDKMKKPKTKESIDTSRQSLIGQVSKLNVNKGLQQEQERDVEICEIVPDFVMLPSHRQN